MENQTNKMHRREALRRTALIMGTALSATTIAGVMQGCKADPELAWTPSFLEDTQAKFVSVMSDTIIPKTDTPGAREAGVPKFIEDMVSLVFNEKQQDEFITGLDACRQWCQATYNDQFIYLSKERQLEAVQSLDMAAKAMRFGSDEEKPQEETLLKAADFFWEMKQLTLTGFFTSEVGATQVLQYKAIPVDYHGCISLEEAGGKTWAT